MPKTRNQLRIVAGEYGGRRLNFPDTKGLRPTAERVRETLFNWLQGEMQGARVLDLFAGSGALGIEALSRGAKEVVFVERAAPVTAKLKQNLDLLAANNAQLIKQDALKWLEKQPSDTAPFDLVLLDPPFADQLLNKLIKQLESSAVLADKAWVYLEQDAQHDWPELPPNWQLYREGKSGQAAFELIQVGKNR